MRKSPISIVILLSSALGLAQPPTGASASATSSRTVLPITLTQTVSADRAHAGDLVRAKTSQIVRLADGDVVPAGTEVVGHVAAANGFRYDKTPYARQREAVLEIQFDSLRMADHDVPLKVTVRAMADPLASREARLPKPSDQDSFSAVSQIGGDELVPSQSEVVDRTGSVVAYSRRNGVYAHLIANGRCDGSTNEVSVDIYSASACGLYGFTDVSVRESDSRAFSSRVSLFSTRTSPKIWRYSTALLEMLPNDGDGR